MRDGGVRTVLLATLFAGAILAGGGARASQFQVVHTLTYAEGGSVQSRQLAIDAGGNIYGLSGEFDDGATGVLFKLSPPSLLSPGWTFTALHTFTTDTDIDAAAPILDASGTIYGGFMGYGPNNRFVYRVKPGQPLQSLAVVDNSMLALDKTTGYLVDADPFGGSAAAGRLVTFRPDGPPQTLYSFGTGDAAQFPNWLLIASDETLYGTTGYGNASGLSPKQFNSGIIYTKTTLQTGIQILASMPKKFGSLTGVTLPDNNGVLYATGCSTGADGKHFGAIVRYSLATGLRPLHKLSVADGFCPPGPPTCGGDGYYYGVNAWGGSTVPNEQLTVGFGTIYRISPTGQYTKLYTFSGGSDGAIPTTTLVRDRHGYFYGATYGRANGSGIVIFRFHP